MNGTKAISKIVVGLPITTKTLSKKKDTRMNLTNGRSKYLLILLISFNASAAKLIDLGEGDTLERWLKFTTLPVIVSFSASWCKPCQQLRAGLNRVAPEFGDSSVMFFYVDVDKNSQLKEKYFIKYFPTVRTFHYGEVLPPSFIGALDDEGIRIFTRELINDPGFGEGKLFCKEKLEQ